MRTLCLTCLLMSGCFALLACSDRLPAPRAIPDDAPPVTESRVDEPLPAADKHAGSWDEQVLAAAADYTSYKRMGDYPRWAPTMCAVPQPNVQFMSEATREHDQKLYFLWIKDIAAYEAEGDEKPQPVGQIIVKESFHPVEAKEGAIKAGGKIYKPGERGPLFVMMKLEDKTAGTDRGWVYATLSEDGKQVTSSGRLETCMGCHTEAGDDRVFGAESKIEWDD
jgi:hypothetical protein